MSVNPVEKTPEDVADEFELWAVYIAIRYRYRLR